MIEGWYYLHENGDLIFKRELDDGTAADIRESTFALAMWPVDPHDRAGAWRILIEGLAVGANRDRVFYLAKKWSCTDEDAMTYADRVGATLKKDGEVWRATRRDCQYPQSPIGNGATALTALADLASQLGLRPSKMWGASFEDLLRGPMQAGSAKALDLNVGSCPKCGASHANESACHACGHQFSDKLRHR